MLVSRPTASQRGLFPTPGTRLALLSQGCVSCWEAAWKLRLLRWERDTPRSPV